MRRNGIFRPTQLAKPMHTPPRPAIGVSAIIFDDEERVLLIRRGTPPAQGFWHAPGGKLEAGEGLAEGVRREVREETGLAVEVGPIMAVVERRQEGFHYVIIDFIAALTDPKQSQAKPADDAADCAWVAEEELGDYLVAEGLLPILERARQTWRRSKNRPPHGAECVGAFNRAGSGLVDMDGSGTDFIG